MLFSVVPLLVVLLGAEGVARLRVSPGCSHADVLLRQASALPSRPADASMRESVPMPSDPLLGWINLPNYEGQNLGAPVRHNALGLRDPERPLDKPSGTRRVVVLGDSSIYGHGIEESAIFVRLLEDALKAEVPGAAVEVINGGVPAYSSLQSLRQLRYVLGPMQPDVVVIANMWSDSMPTEQEDRTWLVGEGPLARLRERARVADTQLSRASAAWCAVKPSSTFSYDDGALFKRVSQPSSRPRNELPTRRVPPAEYRATLETMAGWARAHDAAPLMVALGHPSDRVEGLVGIGELHKANIDAFRGAMKAAAAAQKAPYVDAPAGYAAARANGDHDLFIDSIHPSEHGHRIVADALLAAILGNTEPRRALGLPEVSR